MQQPCLVVLLDKNLPSTDERDHDRHAQPKAHDGDSMGYVNMEKDSPHFDIETIHGAGNDPLKKIVDYNDRVRNEP
jgi:hypothetical protein